MPLTLRSAAAVAAAAIAAVPLLAAGVAVPAAEAATPPATGTVTSVPFTAGKGQGSGQWGYVGDIETIGQGGTTFNYGLAFDPATSALWVTDSGKVSYSRLSCALAGHPTSPCQLGTPRVFVYDRVTADDTMGDYLVDGAYVAGGEGRAGVNDGLGARYEAVGDRTVISAPYAAPAENVLNGPRGVDFAADGTAWVVNSEAVAPLGGPAGAIDRFASDGTELTGAGWTGAWADRDKPGVHFYRTGVSATPSGTVLVNTEASDRLQEYAADGTWIRSIRLDVPAGTFSPTDPGYRNPYSVSVDPIDGSLYLAYNNFRDDAGLRNTAFIEKRDKDGNLISTFGTAQLQAGQVVFSTAVNPFNQHVYAWNQSGAVHEWLPDGTFVRSFTAGTAPGAFPGLTTVRDLEFDEAGRMYLTVAEGTSRARVMILAQTPGPVTSTCATHSADRTQVSLAWECDPALQPTTAQAPVRDYVVEQSVDGGATWAVVPHAAASTETSRTITGLDPAQEYLFRVSAWNEAGNGDWAQFAPAEPVAAVDDAATAAYETAATIDVLANDATVSGAPLDPATLALLDSAGQPTARLDVPGEGVYEVVAGTIRFTPAAGFSGAATPVQYTANGVCVVATATIAATVEPQPLGAISGVVWTDHDGDGTRGAGDGPAPGVTVTLSGTDASGAAVTKSAVTDGTGAYSFADLVAGDYTVTVTPPDGTRVTAAGPDSDVDPVTGAASVTLAPGGTAVADAGLVPLPGSISGSVWSDANGDGVRGDGDGPVADVTVELTGTDAAGAPFTRTTTTGADGSYTFADLPAGDYTMTVIPPAGSTFTVAGTDSTVDQTSGAQTISLAAGGAETVTAGLIRPAPTTPAPTTASPEPTTPAPTTASPEPTTPAPTTASPEPTTPAPTTPAPTTESPEPTTAVPTTAPSTTAPAGSTPAPAAPGGGQGSSSLAGTGVDSPAPAIAAGIALLGVGALIAIRRRRLG